MGKIAKWFWGMVLITTMVAFSSCGVLKKNNCGCPPIPTTGKMKH